MKTIRITYWGNLDGSLDEKLKDAMKAIGGKFVGSGVMFNTSERDLQFLINTPKEG